MKNLFPNKHRVFKKSAPLFLLAGFFLSGCVSFGTYEAQARKWRDERERMQNRINDLEQKLGVVESTVTVKTQGITATLPPLPQPPAEAYSTSTALSMDLLEAKARDEFKEELKKNNLSLSVSSTTMLVSFPGKTLFSDGSETLEQKGQTQAEKLASVMKVATGYSFQVRAYPSESDLGFMRATSLSRYLQDVLGIDHKLISVPASFSGGTDPQHNLAHRVDILFAPTKSSLDSAAHQLTAQSSSGQSLTVDDYRKFLKKEIAAKLADVTLDNNRILLVFQEKSLFEPGSASVSRSGIYLLTRLSSPIHESENAVEITAFPASMVISTARAEAVASTLIDAGVPAKQISIEGTRPHQEGDSEKTRIEIRLISPEKKGQ